MAFSFLYGLIGILLLTAFCLKIIIKSGAVSSLIAPLIFVLSYIVCLLYRKIGHTFQTYRQCRSIVQQGRCRRRQDTRST